MPVIICSARSFPDIGPSVMPHIPCPPATKIPGTPDAPTSGIPSALTGRGPTQTSRMLAQSTPLNSGCADRASASTRD